MEGALYLVRRTCEYLVGYTYVRTYATPLFSYPLMCQYYLYSKALSTRFMSDDVLEKRIAVEENLRNGKKVRRDTTHFLNFCNFFQSVVLLGQSL